MQFDKQMILDLLKNRGNHAQAEQADNELPEKVDTDQHAGLLDKFGVKLSDLKGSLGGIRDKFGH